ncbi:MAG: helix-turn-helix domain-containing protein [Pseudanabaenaceae cyanobacterium]
MPPRLQVKLEDCSPLGKYILQYLERKGMSMNRLAELAGIPQPRLRGACFKGTCPTPETLQKLAKAMGKHHLELYSLAYEGRVTAATDNTLDAILREILATVREMDLEAPATVPSRAQLYRALLELGFRPK